MTTSHSPQPSGSPLWASLYLPALLLDEINSDTTLAIIERRNNRQQIRICNAPSQLAGIYDGMALNSAYALVPDLAVVDYDEKHERTLLNRLGEWAMQFSSIVSIHAPNHILIEIAGSKKLFDGLETLIHLIEAQLQKIGFSGQIGIAPTPHAANLLARANSRLGITDKNRIKPAISQLPVRLLELPEATIEGLCRSGMHHIGNVADISPASLTRRFGCNCVDYLDRLLGRHPDPRTPLRLSDVFERELNLMLEVQDLNALQFATQRMIGELAAFLIAHDKGVNTFRFSLRHEKHAETVLHLRFLHATSQARHLHQVLTERLSQTELIAPVCGLHLFAETFSDIDRDASDLFIKNRRKQNSLGEIIDKLSSRLGDDAVFTLTAVDDHRPEKAWAKSFIDIQTAPPSEWPSRPLWLLKDPVPMSHRQQQSLTLHSDAERIETGWWEQADVRRDYFLLQDKNGTRLWAYKNRNDAANTYYIHGIFS